MAIIINIDVMLAKRKVSVAGERQGHRPFLRNVKRRSYFPLETQAMICVPADYVYADSCPRRLKRMGECEPTNAVAEASQTSRIEALAAPVS